MVAYIARRISVLLVILFGSSFILYNLSAIAGDPIGDLRFSDDPQVQAEVKELEAQTLNEDQQKHLDKLRKELVGDLRFAEYLQMKIDIIESLKVL
jgi:hypothetical protein